MGLLGGPKLLALTTKSPIRGNHCAPLGCRAILGSVKMFLHIKSLFVYITVESNPYYPHGQRQFQQVISTVIAVQIHQYAQQPQHLQIQPSEPEMVATGNTLTHEEGCN